MPPYNPPTLSSLGTYLTQWVKIASGDRVKLAGGMNLSGASVHTNTGYLIFKCTQCNDNWHVGHENFNGNVQDPAAQTIPSVLSDWVKKHRHICKKFQSPSEGYYTKGLCASCKWPYGAHEESWTVQQVFDEKGKPLWSGLPTKSGGQTATFMYDGSEPPAPPSMTLKQYTGRKFREVECESLDTNIEKTSNE